jgi:hypothetical protein
MQQYTFARCAKNLTYATRLEAQGKQLVFTATQLQSEVAHAWSRISALGDLTEKVQKAVEFFSGISVKDAELQRQVEEIKLTLAKIKTIGAARQNEVAKWAHAVADTVHQPLNYLKRELNQASALNEFRECVSNVIRMLRWEDPPSTIQALSRCNGFETPLMPWLKKTAEAWNEYIKTPNTNTLQTLYYCLGEHVDDPQTVDLQIALKQKLEPHLYEALDRSKQEHLRSSAAADVERLIKMYNEATDFATQMRYFDILLGAAQPYLTAAQNAFVVQQLVKLLNHPNYTHEQMNILLQVLERNSSKLDKTFQEKFKTVHPVSLQPATAPPLTVHSTSLHPAAPLHMSQPADQPASPQIATATLGTGSSNPTVPEKAAATSRRHDAFSMQAHRNPYLAEVPESKMIVQGLRDAQGRKHRRLAVPVFAPPSAPQTTADLQLKRKCWAAKAASVAASAFSAQTALIAQLVLQQQLNATVSLRRRCWAAKAASVAAAAFAAQTTLIQRISAPPTGSAANPDLERKRRCWAAKAASVAAAAFAAQSALIPMAVASVQLQASATLKRRCWAAKAASVAAAAFAAQSALIAGLVVAPRAADETVALKRRCWAAKAASVAAAAFAAQSAQIQVLSQQMLKAQASTEMLMQKRKCWAAKAASVAAAAFAAQSALIPQAVVHVMSQSNAALKRRCWAAKAASVAAAAFAAQTALIPQAVVYVLSQSTVAQKRRCWAAKAASVAAAAFAAQSQLIPFAVASVAAQSNAALKRRCWAAKAASVAAAAFAAQSALIAGIVVAPSAADDTVALKRRCWAAKAASVAAAAFAAQSAQIQVLSQQMSTAQASSDALVLKRKCWAAKAASVAAAAFAAQSTLIAQVGVTAQMQETVSLKRRCWAAKAASVAAAAFAAQSALIAGIVVALRAADDTVALKRRCWAAKAASVAAAAFAAQSAQIQVLSQQMSAAQASSDALVLKRRCWAAKAASVAAAAFAAQSTLIAQVGVTAQMQETVSLKRRCWAAKAASVAAAAFEAQTALIRGLFAPRQRDDSALSTAPSPVDGDDAADSDVDRERVSDDESSSVDGGGDAASVAPLPNDSAVSGATTYGSHNSGSFDNGIWTPAGPNLGPMSRNASDANSFATTHGSADSSFTSAADITPSSVSAVSGATTHGNNEEIGSYDGTAWGSSDTTTLSSGDQDAGEITISSHDTRGTDALQTDGKMSDEVSTESEFTPSGSGNFTLGQGELSTVGLRSRRRNFKRIVGKEEARQSRFDVTETMREQSRLNSLKSSRPYY